MAAVMPSLAIAPGVQFTARPALFTPNTSKGKLQTPKNDTGPEGGSQISTSSRGNVMEVNGALSIIEVESILRDKVRYNCGALQQGFQSYDINQSLSITRGEFRRVLESLCLGLTSDQFDSLMSKVPVNKDGTVRYCEFLEQFGGRVTKHTDSRDGTHKYVRTQSPLDLNTDMIEKMLREKMCKNLKSVVKALRLYDYNRDGQLQRHELRKVLDNYCFSMTDQQFDKLCMRCDFHRRGVINYRDFFLRLGVNIDKMATPTTPEGPGGAMQRRPSTQGPERRNVIAPLDSTLANLSIFQIEAEFRKQMRKNYANLKRMFLAFDRHLSGFVSLEDLKSILRQFTMPMSDSLFLELMERLNVKASGKISWEIFLEKFQDPQSYGNGQTIPIKSSHKFFPIRGSDEKMDIKDIVRLLHEHVTNAYSSFKDAFLQLDKNRDGRISRREFRNIFNKFKFRVTDGQFRELMMLLDPQQTRVISYHKFLDLFEERESQDAHKWLKSCHRYNENPAPAILAWETIEELIRDNVVKRWADVSEAVVKADPHGSGAISPKRLRKIVEKYSLVVSDEHFANLMNKMESKDEKGHVSYLEFFGRLGVSVSPGDVEGVSTQIHETSEQTEALRLADQVHRITHADGNAHARADGMSVDELLVRLKDRMAQHNTHIRATFKLYDRSGRGKISKKDFRKVLESHGLHLADTTFHQLCGRLSFHNNHMTYTDFMSNFDDSRTVRPMSDLLKVNNHKVNPVRGDEYGMTAEQAIAKFEVKLRDNFENLRSAFYKFDDNHNGIVTKTNFRRMMDSFMIIMADGEFSRFCEILGVDSKSRIGYRDFLEAFELRDTAEGHKWLTSTHTYNQTQPMKLMTAEQVHRELSEKSHQQYRDLAKAFRTMDSSGNGVISKKELRNTLYKFMLPMSKAEFLKLWSRYDPGGVGHISHEAFLSLLTGGTFAPGDEAGPSRRIVEESERHLEAHLADQAAKHDVLTVHQAQRCAAFTVPQILQQLRDRIRDAYPEFQTAFRKYDKRKKGYLNASDLQRVLVDFNFYLDDDQMYDFLERLQLSKPRSQLTYEGFVTVFEEGRPEQYPSAPPDVNYPLLEHAHLPKDAVDGKLRARIERQVDVLQKAFQAFDAQYTGKIKRPDFRRVLDNFCFKLSDDQFKQLMVSCINATVDGMVDYNEFLDPYKLEHTMDPWFDGVQTQLPDAQPDPLTDQEVSDHIREVVTERFARIGTALADIDYAKIGVVTKKDFQEVLDKHVMRLSEDQFERLWSKLSVNEFNNLDYRDFIAKFMGAEAVTDRPATSSGLPASSRRPVTSDSDILRLRSSWGGRERLQRPFTPLVNAESAEQKLKTKIHRNWKDIQRQCRACDEGNTGQIRPSDFRQIVSRYNLDLSEDDVRKMLLKYDLKNNDQFCYPEFLRHFVLNLCATPDEAATSNGLLGRRKLQPSRLSQTVNVGSGAKAGATTEAASVRLGRCVQDNWKDMRRDFRLADPTSAGAVPPGEFRQTLRKFNINLTEDEFSTLLSKYENFGNGLINYNDFFRSVLMTEA